MTEYPLSHDDGEKLKIRIALLCPMGKKIKSSVLMEIGCCKFVNLYEGSRQGYCTCIEYLAADTRPDAIDSSYSSTNVAQQYTGYFRTHKDQVVFEQRYIDGSYDRVVVNTTFRRSEFCELNCTRVFTGFSPSPRVKRQNRYIRHGCCKSSVVFITPPELPNHTGTTRTLVHFEDRQQYLVKHICEHNSGCMGGCTCSQDNTLYAAVVVKSGITTPGYIEDTEIDFFYLAGC